MDERAKYKLIGVVMILYALIQFVTGIIGTPLIPSINIITLIIGSPIVTFGILVIGVYLITKKKE
jgi:uncharacterized membrane protein (DUF485 family)